MSYFSSLVVPYSVVGKYYIYNSVKSSPKFLFTWA